MIKEVYNHLQTEKNINFEEKEVMYAKQIQAI